MESVSLLAGAAVSALLTELILAVKEVYRCKENCKALLRTLESVEPLVLKVAESSDKGDATCQKWLKTVYDILEEAKGLIAKCTMKSSLFKRIRFAYVDKRCLSLSLKEIDNRIKDKNVEANLLTLSIVQAICNSQCVMSGALVKSPHFELQPVPCKIVAFESNPYKKLKELIIHAANAPLGEPLTIGLKGGGGVGKTLLAKMVNNDRDIQGKYGADSILWITVGHDASVPSIYKTMGKFLNNGDVFERDCGDRKLEDQRNYLIEAFKQKRALLILDDVWESFFNNRAMIEWLDICRGCGSTMLITTRNVSVLNRAKAKAKIEVTSLSKEESWKLFCYHAFESIIPPWGQIENIAKEICVECKGLPLALEVIGSALWGKDDARDWNFALCWLRESKSPCNLTSVDDELFYRLKFSYDELEEDTKKCFLYFAAFPEDFRIPTEDLCRIWHAEKLFGIDDDDNDMFDMGRVKLVSLADRSLIELEKDGRFARIHDVLRDLAIHILKEAKVDEWAYECHFEPGKVLKTFPKIKETTKRLSLVGSTIEYCEVPHDLQIPSLEVCLLSKIFMSNANGIYIPFVFSKCMTKLVHLNLSECYISMELPESIMELKSLVHLDLSWCDDLKELPESIKELKSLVHLDLSRCWNLEELPESIKELKSLVHLDLSRCWNLKELPESIKELKSLVHLDLSGCYDLKELPESIKELKSLVHLNLSWCRNLEELPESIKELKSLVHLDLSRCWNLKELPKSIKELKSLVHLDLSGCDDLKELPESIKELKSLVHLDLSRCWNLKELPESIKELKSLVHLNLSWCRNLEELPESIKELKSLVHLDLSECSKLKELPESIKELKSLVHLNLLGCSNLKELPESIQEFMA